MAWWHASPQYRAGARPEGRRGAKQPGRSQKSYGFFLLRDNARGLRCYRRRGSGCGLSSVSFAAASLTTLPLGLRLLPSNFGTRTSPLLAFGGLPTIQLLQTLRLPAITLVPPPGNELMYAALAKTRSQRESRSTCRWAIAASRL